jgi:hypothetical protein
MTVLLPAVILSMSVLFGGAVLWRGKGPRPLGLIVYITGLSLAWSGFWLLVFYPAVMSFDALLQWKQGLAGQYGTWSPPLLSMLMHVSQLLDGSPALFSFIQGALFWGALLFLIRQVARSDREFLAHSALTVLLPPLWMYSNAATSSSWGAAFLMFATAFLVRFAKGRRETAYWLSVLFLSIAAMFRTEAAVCLIVPAFVRPFLVRREEGLAKRGLVALVTVLVGILPGRLIEFGPRVVREHRVQVHGVFNQYVGTVVHSMAGMGPAEVAREERSIDGVFGKGAFRKLVEGYDCSSGDYIVFTRDGVPAAIKRIPDRKVPFIIGKVVRTALRHPWGYLRHQARYLGYLSQLSGLGYQSWGVLTRDPQYEARRARLGIPYASRLPSVKARYAALMNVLLRSPVLSLVFRHYVFLVLSAAVLVLGIRRRRMEWAIPCLFGLVYAGGFLMVGTADLWRYLLPSYLAAWASWPAALFAVLRRRPAGAS